MYNIKKIGADVEMFLRTPQGNPISAVGLIGGTKANPRPIDNLGSALQEDNVMLEFNIIPAENEEQFCNNINKVLSHIVSELSFKNLLMDITPSRVFSKRQLDNEQACTMGCDPDFNAWELEQNKLLSPDILGNLRTAGGHVHISFTVNSLPPKPLHLFNFVRMLDLYLGVPSILIDRDDRRRLFYGKPGAFRPKPYGLEYRTLSNFWIQHDSYKKWVFNQVSCAVRRLHTEECKGLWEPAGLSEDIRHCIHNSDLNIASALVKKENIALP